MSFISQLKFGVAVQTDFGNFRGASLQSSLEAAVKRLAKRIEGVWYDAGTPYVAWLFAATWQALSFLMKLPVVKAGEIKGRIGPSFIQPSQEKRLTEPIYKR